MTKLSIITITIILAAIGAVYYSLVWALAKLGWRTAVVVNDKGAESSAKAATWVDSILAGEEVIVDNA